MSGRPWPRDPRIELAKAQAEYASALQELRQVRETIRAQGSSPEFERRLGAALDKAARAAARISDLQRN